MLASRLTMDQRLGFLTAILHHFLHMFLASLLLLLVSLPAFLLHTLHSLPTSYTFLLTPLDPHFLLLTLALGLATAGIFTNTKALLLPLLVWNLQSIITGIFPTSPSDLTLAVSLAVQLLLLLLLLSCLGLMASCQHSYRDQLEAADSCQHSYRKQLKAAVSCQHSYRDAADDRAASEGADDGLKEPEGISPEKLEV